MGFGAEHVSGGMPFLSEGHSVSVEDAAEMEGRWEIKVFVTKGLENTQVSPSRLRRVCDPPPQGCGISRPPANGPGPPQMPAQPLASR